MNLQNILNQLYYLTNIPIALYHGLKCDYSFPDAQPHANIARTLLEPYFHEPENCLTLCTSEYILCGLIRFKTTCNKEDYLIFGPITNWRIDINSAQSILNKLLLPEVSPINMHRFLTKHSQIPTAHFYATVRIVNSILNNSSELRIISNINNQTNQDINPPKLDYVRTLNHLPEIEFLDYIRKGKPRELMNSFMHIHERGVSIGNLSDSNLRSFKNNMIAATAIASRAAFEGGLDYEIAISLSDKYIYRIEKLNDIEELHLLNIQILVDFAKQTEKVQRFSRSDPLVLSITNYIGKHIYEKISVEDIACHLNYTAPHLCRHFKRITGNTIAKHIQTFKIEEAQLLLNTTNLSILDICTMLSFSSQSYFTRLFHSVTKITPQQYRKNRSAYH